MQMLVRHLARGFAYVGTRLYGGGLVNDVVDIDAVALGMDVGRDTGNGSDNSEDGGELHFDKDCGLRQLGCFGDPG